jgi:hypothetical protein
MNFHGHIREKTQPESQSLSPGNFFDFDVARHIFGDPRFRRSSYSGHFNLNWHVDVPGENLVLQNDQPIAPVMAVCSWHC